MAGDWIKLHRKIVHSAVFANAELLRLWVVCLINANHKDTHVSVDGINEPVLVKRGQFLTGRFALHDDVYPSKRRQGRLAQRRDAKSAVTVWRQLETLQKLRCISIKTSNKFSIVTIENYGVYQDGESESVQQDVQQVSSRRSAGVQQTITNKNEKNEKNDKNEEESSPAAASVGGKPDPSASLGTTNPDPDPDASAKPRPRNLLFDAVAEVTGSDPKASGGHIGKVAALLARADPAYTPDEVRDWAVKIRELWGMQPTVKMVEVHIGKIRSTDPLTWNRPGNGNGQKIDHSGLLEFMSRGQD